MRRCIAVLRLGSVVWNLMRNGGVRVAQRKECWNLFCLWHLYSSVQISTQPICRQTCEMSILLAFPNGVDRFRHQCSICSKHSLFVLKDIDQCADMGENLHGKLIPGLDRDFGLSHDPNSRGGPGDDQGPDWQCRALGEEADDFREGEDEIAGEKSARVSDISRSVGRWCNVKGCDWSGGGSKTYSIPQS